MSCTAGPHGPTEPDGDARSPCVLDAFNRIRRGRPRDTKGTSRPGNSPVAVYPGSGGAPVRPVPNTRVPWRNRRPGAALVETGGCNLVYFTAYLIHRHTIVTRSRVRRPSPPSPTSRGTKAVQLRAQPPAGRGVAETRHMPVSILPRSGAREEDPARPPSKCLSASYGPEAWWRCTPSHPHSTPCLSLALPLTYRLQN